MHRVLIIINLIIMHDLPFSYAKYEGVWAVNRVLNLDFKPISRNTAKVDCFDCWNVFLSEKTKLKNIFLVEFNL